VKCAMCEKRGKTWEDSDPCCAFEDGRFNRDNWNCATLNALRQISRDIGTYRRDDNADASIGVIPINEATEDDMGYIVLTWYKDRGKTGSAIVVDDGEVPRELTLELAAAVVKRYGAAKEVSA